MNFIWDENKRLMNIKKHGLDFKDVEQVFHNPLILFEDDRFDYGEQRMVAIGLLSVTVVVVVHVEADETIRIISMRKATTNEINTYYANVY
ncbi:MAG: BrnT family toxin [Moraxellaceae bacterium]|nr:BrnT family toxin [Moraxellaceae bacterium]